MGLYARINLHILSNKKLKNVFYISEILQLLFIIVGLTCGMFTRNGVKISSPDSAAGLYVKTRNDQIVKVILVLFTLEI